MPNKAPQMGRLPAPDLLVFKEKKTPQEERKQGIVWANVEEGLCKGEQLNLQ